MALEDYPGSGLASMALDGAIETISKISSWLRSIGVPAQRTDVWVSAAPRDNTGGRRDDTQFRNFDRTQFVNYLQDTIASDELGGTLFVYWLGHGFLAGKDHAHHLLLPEATIDQLRSIEVTALSSLLKGENFSQFTHQVLIFDTCRQAASFNGGGVAAPEVIIPRPIDWINQIRQCRIYACLEGQATQIRSGTGTVLSNTLISAIGQSELSHWPDFPLLLAEVGRSAFSELAPHHRLVAYATGWNGEVSDFWFPTSIDDGRKQI